MSMSKIMSIKLDKQLFIDIKNISKTLNMTSSDFIRNAIKKELEKNKNNFMVRMSNVPFCENEEEQELLNMLDSLTDDDLTIINKDIIKL